MKTYKFRGMDVMGKYASGTLEATNREAAIKFLSSRSIVATSLIARNTNGRFLKKLGLGERRVGGEQLLTFTEELASLVDAGVPIKTGMDILTVDSEGESLQRTAGEIATALGAGSSLCDELRRYPKIFSRLYVAIVAVGEKTGRLPEALTRMAMYIKNSESLKNKVRAALYYPALVFSFALFVTTMFFILAVPRVEAIYVSIGVQLPPVTLLLIRIEHLLRFGWPYILVGVIAGSFFLRRYLKTDAGQLLKDKLIFRLPVFSPLFRHIAIARFAHTLSSIYGSGVPLLESMDLVAQSTANRVIEGAVIKLIDALRKGETIVEPLRRSGVFTEMAISMMSIGEMSGNLDTMLQKLAAFYDEKVESAVKGLSSLVEPIIIIGVGFMVAFLIIALGLPFLNIGGAAMHLIQ